MCQKTKAFVLAKMSGFPGPQISQIWPGPGLDFGGEGEMLASHIEPFRGWRDLMYESMLNTFNAAPEEPPMTAAEREAASILQTRVARSHVRATLGQSMDAAASMLPRALSSASTAGFSGDVDTSITNQ